MAARRYTIDADSEIVVEPEATFERIYRREGVCHYRLPPEEAARWLQLYTIEQLMEQLKELMMHVRAVAHHVSMLSAPAVPKGKRGKRCE